MVQPLTQWSSGRSAEAMRKASRAKLWQATVVYWGQGTGAPQCQVDRPPEPGNLGQPVKMRPLKI